MKRLWLAAILIPGAVAAQQVRDSIISVNASRPSTLVPDRMAAWVVIEGSGETPGDANARLDTKLKSVSEAIRALGSAATSDRPMPYGVSMAQNQNGYPMPAVPTTYVARAVIRLQLMKLDQMSANVASILSAGATNVSSPTFESSAVDAARREKIAEAVAVARADAEALASALGGKLGALVDVSATGNVNNLFGPSSQIFFDNRYNGGQVAAPSITFTTNVTMRFRLVR